MQFGKKQVLSPLEYMPKIARSDEWSRCTHRLQPRSRMCQNWPDDDAKVNRAREDLYIAASVLVEKEDWLRNLHKEVPEGSIFHGIDARSEQRRRWRKSPSIFFVYRKMALKQLHLQRLENSGCSRYGFYADVWSRLTRAEDEADALFKKRQARLRKLMANVASNLLLSMTIAWREYVHRSKRARWLLARHMVGTERSILCAWRKYVYIQKKAKDVLRRVMLRLGRAFFVTWMDFVSRRRLLRSIVNAWRSTSNSALERRLQVAKYLLRGSLERLFLAWRDAAINEVKVRRCATRIFHRIIYKCYQAWAGHTRTTRHVKAALCRMLAGCLSCHFEAWQRYTKLVKVARNFALVVFHEQCRRILRAWRVQAHADHLKNLDEKHNCQATLALFYARTSRRRLRKHLIDESWRDTVASSDTARYSLQ